VVANLYAQAGRPGQQTQLLALNLSRRVNLPQRGSQTNLAPIQPTLRASKPSPFFVLKPVRMMPPVLEVSLQTIPFPAEAQIQKVEQLTVAENQLWIIATDESPEHRAGNPDLSAEMLSENESPWSSIPQSRKNRDLSAGFWAPRGYRFGPRFSFMDCGPEGRRHRCPHTGHQRLRSE